MAHLVLLAGPFVVVGRPGTGGAGLIALAVVWGALEALSAPRRAVGGRWPPLLLPAATGLTILVVLEVALLVPGHPPPVMMASGWILLGAGIALRVAAIRTLGTWFRDDVVLLDGQLLITAGVYRWLRHPSEVGTLLIAVGAATSTGSVGAAAVAGLVLGPLVLVRTRLEDRLLAPLRGRSMA